ncbi:MAG: hypothetical protein EA369_04120 [Bradymonadales bacterium]|nr:MAG: hypothetical protein EA369_04120 [Bradymonadales bacterium]
MNNSLRLKQLGLAFVTGVLMAACGSEDLGFNPPPNQNIIGQGIEVVRPNANDKACAEVPVVAKGDRNFCIGNEALRARFSLTTESGASGGILASSFHSYQDGDACIVQFMATGLTVGETYTVRMEEMVVSDGDGNNLVAKAGPVGEFKVYSGAEANYCGSSFRIVSSESKQEPQATSLFNGVGVDPNTGDWSFPTSQTAFGIVNQLLSNMSSSWFQGTNNQDYIVLRFNRPVKESSLRNSMGVLNMRALFPVGGLVNPLSATHVNQVDYYESCDFDDNSVLEGQSIAGADVCMILRDQGRTLYIFPPNTTHVRTNINGGLTVQGGGWSSLAVCGINTGLINILPSFESESGLRLNSGFFVDWVRFNDPC